MGIKKKKGKLVKTTNNRTMARVRERQVARLMLSGKSVKEIAKKLGYSFHSVYNLTQRDTFQAQLAILEKDVYGAADRELGLLYRDSVRRLRKMINKADHPEVILAAIDKAFGVTGRKQAKIIDTLESGYEEGYVRANGNNTKALPSGITELPENVVSMGKQFLKATRSVQNPNYPIRKAP